MHQTFTTNSPGETQKVAKELIKQFQGGVIIGLHGELGSGKTCFAKGVISSLTGLNVDEITSPTFTLIEEYPGDPVVYHVDLYRMEDPKEAEELPWDDLFAEDVVTLIEWPEKLENLLSHCQVEIKFIRNKGSERNIEILSR